MPAYIAYAMPFRHDAADAAAAAGEPRAFTMRLLR